MELGDRSRQAIITGLVVYGATLLVVTASFAVYQLVRPFFAQDVNPPEMGAYLKGQGVEPMVVSRGIRCTRIAADKVTGALHEEAIPGCGDPAPEIGMTKGALESIRDTLRGK